jgi:glycosyltransferase involved in cell wall biosynthesis
VTGDESLISVVVPAYNASQYLETTLASIRRQTHANLEVLVVDDASTDDTAAIVERIAIVDPRVRLVRQDRNQGRSAARNRGIDEARGEWVCPCDADDLWAIERLEQFMLAATEFPDAQLIADDRIGFSVGPDGAVHLDHRFASRSTVMVGTRHRLAVRNWFVDQQCTTSPIVRRSFLEATGTRYPVEMAAGEDLAFNLELVFSPVPCRPARVGLPMYYYRTGESSRGNMAAGQVRMIRYVLERTHSDELERLARRTGPGWVAFYRRADRKWAAAGRASDDDVAADVAGAPSSTLRGYQRLVSHKLLELAGRVADRRLRPAIAADIAAQLREH